MSAPRFEEVPADLRHYAQWVVWRHEQLPGREAPTKVPYTPATQRRASSTDPETWRAFGVARRAYELGGFDGIGFMFSRDDPFIGIDIDHCRDEQTGELSERARAILADLGTYAELSPGAGAHAIARGTLEGDWHRRGDVEIYWQERYFTVTGDRLPDLPAEPAYVNGPLQALYDSLAPARPAPALIPEIHGSGNLSDEEVLRLAAASRQGLKFQSLMAGDTFGYGGDDSAADLALAGILAFWCGNDLAQMDRLFRGSNLLRPKWDSRRGGSTYGGQTLRRALCPEPYAPPDPRNTRIRDDPPDESLIPEIQGSGNSPPEPGLIPEIHGSGGSSDMALLIPEIQGSGMTTMPRASPTPWTAKNRDEDAMRMAALEAEVMRLQGERDGFAARLADAQALLDRYEAEGIAQALRNEQLRADRQEAAHRDLVALLENQDLTFRQRVVVALAKEMGSAFIARPRFGMEPEVPAPVPVRMGELEQRAGISRGTAAQAIKPAAALGLITRVETRRDVNRPDGTHEVRTEILIGPGTGAVQESWEDRHRRHEVERQRALRQDRQDKVAALLATLEQLRQAQTRAGMGCICGGDLLPTGYVCDTCYNGLSPAAVLELPPLPEVLEAVPLIPEKHGSITRSICSVKYRDQGPPGLRDPVPL